MIRQTVRGLIRLSGAPIKRPCLRTVVLLCVLATLVTQQGMAEDRAPSLPIEIMKMTALLFETSDDLGGYEIQLDLAEISPAHQGSTAYIEYRAEDRKYSAEVLYIDDQNLLGGGRLRRGSTVWFVYKGQLNRDYRFAIPRTTWSGTLRRPHVFALRRIDRSRTITVTATVPDATVYVDNVARGHTPLDFTVPDLRELEIRVSKAGYVSQSRRLIANKAQQTVEFNLGTEDMPVRRFTVNAMSSGTISVNGQRIGQINQPFRLRGRIPQPLPVTLTANGVSKDYRLDHSGTTNPVWSLDFDAEPRAVTVPEVPADLFRVNVEGAHRRHSATRYTVFGTDTRLVVTASHNWRYQKSLQGPPGSEIIIDDLDVAPRDVALTVSPRRLEDYQVQVEGPHKKMDDGNYTVYGPQVNIVISAEDMLTQSVMVQEPPHSTMDVRIRLRPDNPARRSRYGSRGLAVGASYLMPPADAFLDAETVPGGKIALLISDPLRRLHGEWGITAIVPQGDFEPYSSYVENFGLVALSTYVGMGFKVWLGSQSYLYSLLSGHVGVFGTYHGDVKSAYDTVSSDQSLESERSFYTEAELTLGWRWLRPNPGFFVEAAVRPQSIDDRWDWLPVFTAGISLVGRE